MSVPSKALRGEIELILLACAIWMIMTATKMAWATATAVSKALGLGNLVLGSRGRLRTRGRGAETTVGVQHSAGPVQIQATFSFFPRWGLGCERHGGADVARRWHGGGAVGGGCG
jgi:hypothetical protein